MQCSRRRSSRVSTSSEKIKFTDSAISEKIKFHHLVSILLGEYCELLMHVLARVDIESQICSGRTPKSEGLFTSHEVVHTQGHTCRPTNVCLVMLSFVAGVH